MRFVTLRGMTIKLMDKKAAREMEALIAAVRLHQLGDLNGAEVAYRKLIKGNPNNFNASGFLGALFLQRGEYELALRFLDTSLGVRREQPTVLRDSLAEFVTPDISQSRVNVDS